MQNKTPFEECALFVKNETYKPFIFPGFHEAWEEHESAHWTPAEVTLVADQAVYRNLSIGEKDFIRSLLLFFTQADVDVMEGYTTEYFKRFKNMEIQRLLASITAREATHVNAYALFQTTIGLPDEEFDKFRAVPEIMAKAEFSHDAVNSNPECIEDMMKLVATNTIFGEGMALFSTFANLYKFADERNMSGLHSIVLWSIVDENQHVDEMTDAFNIMKDHIDQRSWIAVKDDIRDIAEKMMVNELNFLDWLFRENPIAESVVNFGDVREYVEAIAYARASAIGVDIFDRPDQEKLSKNPVYKLMVQFTEGDILANTFEVRSVAYTKRIDMADATEMKFPL